MARLNRKVSEADVEAAIGDLSTDEPETAKNDVIRLIRDLWRLEDVLNAADRKEQVDHLQKVLKTLDALTDLLNRPDPNIQRLLGHLLKDILVNDLGDHGVRALMPEVAPEPRLSRGQLPRARDNLGSGATSGMRARRGYDFRPLIDRNAVEQIYKNHGIDVLARLIEDLKRPIAEFIDAIPPNKRGPRADPIRTYLIRHAAVVFFNATGETPPKTAGSKFEHFCSALMGLLDLDDVGLTEAIKRHRPDLGS